MSYQRKKDQDKPEVWGANLLGEILAEGFRRTDKNITIVDYVRNICRIEPWVTQRAIMKAFFSEELFNDELEVLERWARDGKTNWKPGKKYKNLCFEAGMRSSKCVTDSTVIPTSQGIIRPTELLPEVEEGEEAETELLGLKVMTRNGSKLVASGVSQGAKDGHRITTERGYTLAGSTEHPVLAVDDFHRPFLSKFQGVLPTGYNSNWKELRHVALRDWVVLQRGNTVWGEDRALGYDEPVSLHHKTTWTAKLPHETSPDLAEFIGYVMARGLNFTIPTRFYVSRRGDDGLTKVEPLLAIEHSHGVGVSSEVSHTSDGVHRRCVTGTHRTKVQGTGSGIHVLPGVVGGDVSFHSGTVVDGSRSIYAPISSHSHESLGVLSTSDQLVLNPVPVTADMPVGIPGHHDRAGRHVVLDDDVEADPIGQSLGGDRFKNLAYSLFAYPISERGTTSSFHKRVWGFYNQRAIRFLNWCGLKPAGMSDLEIPWVVRSGSRESLRTFLKTFITERTTVKEGMDSGTEIVIWHGSVKLIKELMHLLLLFGVRSKYRMGSNPGGRGPAHFLYLSGDDYTDFYKYIIDGQIFKTEHGEYSELFADRVIRKYDIREPMYDLCVPEGQEFIGNGFVVHNTAIASFLITYIFYKLMNLENPGLHYGQLPGQPLYITVVATSEEQSKDTIYGYCCTRMKESPYFANLIREGRLEVTATRISYPEKNLYIRAGHSNQKGLVGTTAPVFCMDEANRFDSEMNQTGLGLSMYENVGKATKTFAHYSDIGFRIVISSAWARGDVTDQLIGMCEKDPDNQTKTLFFKLSTFDVNPTVSRDEFADTYILNREQALRDYENIRPGSTERLFTPEMLQPATDRWKTEVKDQVAFFKNYQFYEGNQYYVGKELQSVRRATIGQMISYAALDVAISGDKYALAIGHGIPDPDGDGGVIAVIDLVTYWEPFMSDQGQFHIVNFNNVEDIFLKLAKARIVTEVHSDRYNSEGSLQLFNRNGILPIRSSEQNKVQYNNYMAFKVGLNQRKVWLPPDSLLIKEAEHVMLINGKKIDHPEFFDDKQKGSKDLMDCATKVVARILKDDGLVYSYHEQSIDSLGPAALKQSRVAPASALNNFLQGRGGSGYGAMPPHLSPGWGPGGF